MPRLTFSKFKSLVLQMKQCGIKKKEEQLIFSIISNIGLEYSLFVSTFHLGKMTVPNYRMPTLEDCMESLAQEQDKLVQMGTIKSTKDQALAASVSNQGKGKKKPKDSKHQEKKKEENPKYYDGDLNPRKDK